MCKAFFWAVMFSILNHFSGKTFNMGCAVAWDNPKGLSSMKQTSQWTWGLCIVFNPLFPLHIGPVTGHGCLLYGAWPGTNGANGCQFKKIFDAGRVQASF